MPTPKMVNERAEAFRVWCQEGRQNAAETARLCGLAEQTVRGWAHDENWKARWHNTLTPELHQHLGQLKLGLSASMPAVIETLKHEMVSADTSAMRIRAATQLGNLYVALVAAKLEPDDPQVIETTFEAVEPSGYLEANVLDSEKGFKQKGYYHKR